MGPRFWAQSQLREPSFVPFRLLGSSFWSLSLACTYPSICLSQGCRLRDFVPAVRSLAASFEILLLMANLQKVGQSKTKDFFALIPQPEAHAGAKKRSLSGGGHILFGYPHPRWGRKCDKDGTCRTAIVFFLLLLSTSLPPPRASS